MVSCYYPTDPFADEGDPIGDVESSKNYIHIRLQQRNGRKTLTTLQGLPKGTRVFALCLHMVVSDVPLFSFAQLLYFQYTTLKSC